jgi:hypothetical protein
MVSALHAALFKRSLWLLETRLQTIVFWLIFAGAAYYAWDYYTSIGEPASQAERLIVSLFFALIPSLAFKGVSFFLLALLDLSLVLNPNVRVDLRYPLPKVSGRLERTLVEREVPHFNIASFTVAGLTARIVTMFRLRFKANLPYNVVVTKPFLVVRAIEAPATRESARLNRVTVELGGREQAFTRVTILNEDTIEARSLAKVLETNLKVF